MTLDTKYGKIDATVQDGRTVLVLVGEADAAEEAREPLALPRNADACGRAHFHLRDGRWTSGYGEWYLRRSDRRDLTPTMKETAHDAIAEALALIDEEDLDAAQYSKNLDLATKRREAAEALQKVAVELIAQATALEMDRGARVAYLERRHSGYPEDATAVRTSSGEMLFVDEPRAWGLRDVWGGARKYGGDDGWTERS